MFIDLLDKQSATYQNTKVMQDKFSSSSLVSSHITLQSCQTNNHLWILQERIYYNGKDAKRILDAFDKRSYRPWLFSPITTKTR